MLLNGKLPPRLSFIFFFSPFPSPADDTPHSLMVFESAANVEECVSGSMPARREGRFDKRMRKHISHSGAHVEVVFSPMCSCRWDCHAWG